MMSDCSITFADELSAQHQRKARSLRDPDPDGRPEVLSSIGCVFDRCVRLDQVRSNRVTCDQHDSRSLACDEHDRPHICRTDCGRQRLIALVRLFDRTATTARSLRLGYWKTSARRRRLHGTRFRHHLRRCVARHPCAMTEHPREDDQHTEQRDGCKAMHHADRFRCGLCLIVPVTLSTSSTIPAVRMRRSTICPRTMPVR